MGGAYLLSDRDQELQGLGINVSNLNTSLATRQHFSVTEQKDLLGKEDPITFTGRVDTDIVLGIGGMRAEWLNDKSVEGTSGALDLLGFTSFTLDPSSSLFPFLV
jgi:hypothetical protein